MTTSEGNPTLEEQIDEWRSYLRSRQAIHSADVAELEDHLREVIDDLVDAGLATDEAFLVAVKRMGKLDALSREFAREHSERLWKQLVVAPTDADESRTRVRIDAVVAFCLAVAAAVLIKMPALFRIQIDEDISFYARNFSLFVLPLLTGYFAWKRQLDASNTRWLAGAFVVAAVLANVYPFAPDGHTEVLVALHLPIALWVVVGIAYAGVRWSEVAGRMDFIKSAHRKAFRLAGIWKDVLITTCFPCGEIKLWDLDKLEAIKSIPIAACNSGQLTIYEDCAFLASRGIDGLERVAMDRLL